MYVAFRLKGSDEELDDYITKKLNYYDYDVNDFDNNIPFNNSKDANFLKVVNKALTILYKLFMFENIELDMNYTYFKVLYVNYFVKSTI